MNSMYHLMRIHSSIIISPFDLQKGAFLLPCRIKFGVNINLFRSNIMNITTKPIRASHLQQPDPVKTEIILEHRHPSGYYLYQCPTNVPYSERLLCPSHHSGININERCCQLIGYEEANGIRRMCDGSVIYPPNQGSIFPK